MFLVSRHKLMEIKSFRLLNQIAQLESLRHVKRVQKKFVQGGLYLSYSQVLQYFPLICSYNLILWLGFQY